MKVPRHEELYGDRTLLMTESGLANARRLQKDGNFATLGSIAKKGNGSMLDGIVRCPQSNPVARGLEL